MKPNLKTWLGIFLLIASVALFSACAPTGDDAEPTTPDVTQPEPDPEPTTPPPGPTDMEVAATAAKTAADEAKTASEMAGAARDAANDARMNLAAIQTGEMSMGHAMDTEKYAKMAMDEYEKAKAASEAAADAEDLVTALREQIKAENARDAAQKAQMDAETAQGKAEKYAMMEVMVDGATYSVGDTSITDNGLSRSEAGKLTGKLADMAVTTPGMRTINGLPVFWDQNDDGTATQVADRTAEAVKHRRHVRLRRRQQSLDLSHVVLGHEEADAIREER